MGLGRRSGSELFIVDNSDADWKVRDYLLDWWGLAKTIDIATGYFEIGALLALRVGRRCPRSPPCLISTFLPALQPLATSTL